MYNYTSTHFRRAVILTGYHVIKKAFMLDVFSGRPNEKLRRHIYHNPHQIGLAANLTSSSEWRSQKKVSKTIMRSLGNSHQNTEQKIQAECATLLKVFDGHQGKAFDPVILVHSCITNIVCGLLCGVVYEHTDPEFYKLSSNLRKLFKTNFAYPELEIFPLLRYSPFYQKFISDFKFLVGEILEFIQQKINLNKEQDVDQPSNYMQVIIHIIHIILKDLLINIIIV